tara:strand:- start:15 stop:242 length:228 start_codon:yes stop_codon:yes gene_type:complete
MSDQITRVMIHPGIWEEKKDCDECGGEGRTWYETTVYVPPGIACSPFVERLLECERCGGSGLIDIDDDVSSCEDS